MEAHFAKSPIRRLDLRHTDPGLHKKMSGWSKRTRTPSQKALEVARHQQQKMEEVARGAENVGFAGIGERHASQVGAWGGDELKSSF